MTQIIWLFNLTIQLDYSKQSYWNYNKHAMHIKNGKGGLDYAIINVFHGRSISI